MGCNKYQNYMNAKEVLNKIENKNDDFILNLNNMLPIFYKMEIFRKLKCTEIIKLIFDFLTINKFQIKSNYNEDMKYLSPINLFCIYLKKISLILNKRNLNKFIIKKLYFFFKIFDY